MEPGSTSPLWSRCTCGLGADKRQRLWPGSQTGRYLFAVVCAAPGRRALVRAGAGLLTVKLLPGQGGLRGEEPSEMEKFLRQAQGRQTHPSVDRGGGPPRPGQPL